MRRIFFMALCLTWIAPAIRAADFVWTNNPWGQITVFGSGDLATRLEVESTVGAVNESDSLIYLDTLTLPAEIEAFAKSGGNSLTSRAQLSVEESNDSGLLVEGLASVTPNSTTGSGVGEIKLYMLIQLFEPAAVQWLEMSSSVDIAGTFQLDLFPSNGDGAVLGSSVLSFSGDALGAERSYASSQAGFYLLEMTASSGMVNQGSMDFLYRVDIVSVPEPGVAALVAVAGAGIWILRRRRTA